MSEMNTASYPCPEEPGFTARPINTNSYRFVDSHCHLDALEFEQDLQAVRLRAREGGVDLCLLPAVDKMSFEKVARLAHQFKDVYALGIHPLYTTKAKESDLDFLVECVSSAQKVHDPRMIAIGEIGLDKSVPGLNWDKQVFFYETQLRTASEFNLPVVLHVRQSVDFILKGLRKIRVCGGIAHAFNGSLQQAHQLIDLGFKLGFGGALTYPRALHLRKLAKELPIDCIVLETDSPDIVPSWLYVNAERRSKGALQARNEPLEILKIAAELSSLRGISKEELMYATRQNFFSLFNLNDL